MHSFFNPTHTYFKRNKRLAASEFSLDILMLTYFIIIFRNVINQQSKTDEHICCSIHQDWLSFGDIEKFEQKLKRTEYFRDYRL